MKRSIGEILFDRLNEIFMLLLVLVTLYPFTYVLFSSVSEPSRLLKQRGLLLKPLGFTLEGYRLVLENPNVTTGYLNTIFYVVAGTFLNILVTTMLAYVLSRKKLFWKNAIMFIVVFTMFFSGGLIPTFLTVKGLGLIDSRWALILPGLVSAWNMIIMRTSFMAIPDSMEESAKIDGANDLTILFRVIVPLSLPVMAVMVLFYGVGHWNSWFSAMIYLRSRSLYPLQLFLREILITNNTESMMLETVVGKSQALAELIKYCTIIVATVPILVLYPFLQKYFVKGIMIGALKG